MHPNTVLHDCLSHGDMTSIAVLAGCSPQHVSAYCSQEGPPSPYASFCKFLFLVHSVNPAAAQKIVEDAQLRLEEWQRDSRRSRGGRAQREAEPGVLVGGIARETSELVLARLAELPRRQQRQEALDVIAAAQRFLRALEDEDRGVAGSENSAQRERAVAREGEGDRSLRVARNR